MTTRATSRKAILPWLTLPILLLGACANDPDDAPSTPDGENSSSSADASSETPNPSTGDNAQSGTFTVDGRDLFLDCVGAGETTMVLEVGEGAPYQALAAIADTYRSQMRVCSYDRIGVSRDVVSDLHGLLEVADVPDPYLLVGHSAGGLLVQAYAATYPDEIAGVVAINPVPPWQPWSSLAFKEMNPQERRDETDYYAGANGESLDYQEVSHLLASHPAPQDVPLHLLISTVAQCESLEDLCGRTYPAYEQIMSNISREWNQGRLSQVEAPHDIHTADMGAVQRAIDDVITRSASQSSE